MKKEYCVAIRTLGTAREKYQVLLDSLKAQTIQPKKILVYIPHGYTAPKETIGVEQIVRCEKGMVMQRSLFFDEVDTDYILFCDDDMYLPPTMMEELFVGLSENQAECVVPICGPNHKRNLLKEIILYLYSGSSTRRNDGWFVKINRDASFSVNNDIQTRYLPTQSAPFACFLCSKSAYSSIHYDDERWLDSFSYASFDDQLFFYKMFLMNHRVLVDLGTGIKHLDARGGVRVDTTQRMYFKKKLLYILWYRTIYDIKNKSRLEKTKCQLAFFARNTIGLIALFVDVVKYKHLNYLIDYFRGFRDGRRYVHSEEYKKIPAFDAYIEKEEK